MAPSARLDADYLTDLEHKARRFSGAYTGTSGTLAAGIIHLLNERKTMTAAFDQLEQDNQALREAVEARLAGATPAAEAACDEPAFTGDVIHEPYPVDWILQGERTLHDEPKPLGMGVINAPADDATPAEHLLHEAIAVIRDRRPKYGGPCKHFARTVGMINAAFADVLTRPLTPSDWALIMTLDKVARFLGPTKTPDQITDLAGYAACLAECERQP